MKEKTKSHAKSEQERGFLMSCFLSQAVWAVSGLILLLIFCTVAISMADPDSVLFPLSLCALYLSSMISGIAAVRYSGDGIMSGLVSGTITAIIVFMVSALPFSGENFEITESLIYGLMIIPASVVGALIGRKRNKNKPSHKKHR